jgi:hypothetical protein
MPSLFIFKRNLAARVGLHRSSWRTLSERLVLTLVLQMMLPGAYGQAPKQPAYLAVPPLVTFASTGSSKVDISLLDPAGRPTVADRDIELKVAATGAKLDADTVTIKKGQSSAAVNVTKEQPGVAELRVEAPTTIKSATVPINVFAPKVTNFNCRSVSA